MAENKNTTENNKNSGIAENKRTALGKNYGENPRRVLR